MNYLRMVHNTLFYIGGVLDDWYEYIKKDTSKQQFTVASGGGAAHCWAVQSVTVRTPYYF